MSRIRSTWWSGVDGLCGLHGSRGDAAPAARPGRRASDVVKVQLRVGAVALLILASTAEAYTPALPVSQSGFLRAPLALSSHVRPVAPLLSRCSERRGLCGALLMAVEDPGPNGKDEAGKDGAGGEGSRGGSGQDVFQLSGESAPVRVSKRQLAWLALRSMFKRAVGREAYYSAGRIKREMGKLEQEHLQMLERELLSESRKMHEKEESMRSRGALARLEADLNAAVDEQDFTKARSTPAAAHLSFLPPSASPLPMHAAQAPCGCASHRRTHHPE